MPVQLSPEEKMLSKQILNCVLIWEKSQPRRKLASRVGVSTAALGQWAGGNNRIAQHNFIALLEALLPENREGFLPTHIDQLVTAHENAYPERKKEDVQKIISGTVEPPHDWPGPLTLSATVPLLVSAMLLLNKPALFSVIVPLTFFVFSVWFFEASKRHQLARIQVGQYLSERMYRETYKKLLNQILDFTDRWFLSKAHYEDEKNDLLSPRRAWTVRLFARTVLMALLYPVAAMFFQWLILDEEVWFGEMVLLHDTPTIGKVLVVGVYLGSFIAAIGTLNQEFVTRRISLIIAITATILGLLLLGFVFGPAVPGIALTANWFSGTVATIVVIVFTLLCFFRKIDLIVGPAIGAAMGGTLVAILSNRIESLAIRLARDNEAAYVFIDGFVSFVVVLGVTLFVTFPLLRWLRKLVDTGSLAATLVSSAVPVFAILLMAFGTGYLEKPGYFIILGLIPTINAVFDFGSIGLTRWALRIGSKSVGPRTIACSVLDLIAALLIFLVLGCTCIAIFAFVNFVAFSVSGTPSVQLVNLNLGEETNIFQQIVNHPRRYVWLYITFVTTLIPTLIHASIAVFALGPTLLPSPISMRLAEYFLKSRYTLGEAVIGVMPFAVWTTFSLLAPIAIILGIAGLATENFCELGTELISVFVHFRSLISSSAYPTQAIDTSGMCFGG